MPRPIPCALIVILLFSVATPATAQTCSSYAWGETVTRAFTFVYQQKVPLGAEIAAQYGEQIDAEYNRFANLFQTSLPTPITIRIYPTGSDYYCLNPLAPTIPGGENNGNQEPANSKNGQTHSHIDGREIALIAQYILADPEGWQLEGFDSLRHELAILFVHHLSGGKAPPGLEMGMGIYAEDPAHTFERHLAATTPPTQTPSMSWRSLWEAPDTIQNPEISLQTASIVAFLVDVYGWEKFTVLLSSLRTSESYRTALSEVYETDSGTLEEQWFTYYPLYFDGRWRDNALYEFSLSAYEQMISAGAYQAANDGLARVILLLTQRGDQSELLAQAQTLQEIAISGLEADGLARQSFQSYQEGDYSSAFNFAIQAIEKYTPLKDTRNQNTLLTIQSRAEEILTLRAELDTLQLTHTPSDAPRILEIAPRLGELGDTTGQIQAENLITQINEQRKQQAVSAGIVGTGIGLALLTFRIAVVRRRIPPEVLVQY